ncbi:hypothetical protein JOF53_007142 [Crossiella equi]|uniref:DUF4333 domain-containing protein n=1 Tax=Crossiella equi TaxID=130796 RepID=A0ABS5ARE1_9PSEU|nr:DUF4333 domain-containing protein [Crossiella equi]MBP2478270.1 hypothetical protein [Crossiella equi]
MSNPYQPQQPGQQPWGQQPGQPPQPQWGQPQQQPGWGGQPQPGQQPQWGQPQQPAPNTPGGGFPGGPGTPGGGFPGGPGAAPYGAPPQGKSGGSAKKPLLYGLVGLVLIGVVFGVLAVLGVFTTKVLDTRAVQTGVQKVLTENFGIAKVTAVTCPNRPEIKQGNTFTCTATVDGKQRQVPVKLTNNEGEYEVGQPK